MSGLLTAAKTTPERMPNSATATVISSSKLALAAVTASVVFAVIGAHGSPHNETHKEHQHKGDQRWQGDPNHIA